MKKELVDYDIISRLIYSEGFRDFVSTYNVLITAALSFVTLAVIVLFFVNVTKMTAASDNDYQRRIAINGILVCAICFAFIGGIDVIYGIILSLIFGS